MPIHDVGYRRWRGRLMSTFTRWWVITETGIKINFKSSWVRRTLLVAWLPVIVAGVGIFFGEKLLDYWTKNPAIRMQARDALNEGDQQLNITEQIQVLDRNDDGVLEFSEVPESLRRGFRELDVDQDGQVTPVEVAVGAEGYIMFKRFENAAVTFHNFDPVREAFISGDQNRARNAMWSWVLLNFFRSFQGVTVILLLGLIVPPLVAQDVRSRAFQLYYARPIGRLDYIVGKLAVPAFFVSLITTFPALGLYCFGVMMSPDLTVLYDTWQIPLQILVASVVLILPTCALALMFSAMTHESRFAGFAWFTVWGLGIVAFSVIYTVKLAQQNEPVSIETHWTLISLYNTLHKAQGWIFGLESRFGYVAPSFLLLGAITLFSLTILYRRVAAPLRS